MVDTKDIYVANFIETLGNLAKSPELTKQGIVSVAAAISQEFEEDPDTLDIARIILQLAAGIPTCFSCGAAKVHCDCETGVKEILQPT